MTATRPRLLALSYHFDHILPVEGGKCILFGEQEGTKATDPFLLFAITQEHSDLDNGANSLAGRIYPLKQKGGV